MFFRTTIALVAVFGCIGITIVLRTIRWMDRRQPSRPPQLAGNENDSRLRADERLRRTTRGAESPAGIVPAQSPEINTARSPRQTNIGQVPSYPSTGYPSPYAPSPLQPEPDYFPSRPPAVISHGHTRSGRYEDYGSTPMPFHPSPTTASPVSPSTFNPPPNALSHASAVPSLADAERLLRPENVASRPIPRQPNNIAGDVLPVAQQQQQDPPPMYTEEDYYAGPSRSAVPIAASFTSPRGPEESQAAAMHKLAAVHGHSKN